MSIRLTFGLTCCIFICIIGVNEVYSSLHFKKHDADVRASNKPRHLVQFNCTWFSMMDLLHDLKVLKPMRDELRGKYQDYGVQENFDIRNFSKLHDNLSELELLIKHYTYCIVFKERWSYIFWLKLTRRIISLWLDAARDKLTEERDSYLWVGLKSGRDLGTQVDIYNNINKLTKEMDLFESGLNLHTVEENELERLNKTKKRKKK